MVKNKKRSIAIIAALALVISLMPSAAFGATTAIKTVTGLKAEQLSNTSAELRWHYVNGAEGYKVYRAVSKAGKYTLIKTLTRGKTTRFVSKNLKLGNTYYYKVKAVDTVNGTKKISKKFSAIASIKMEQCTPDYAVEFPEKLNADGSLTVTIVNKSKEQIQISAAPMIFNDLNDWQKDGVLLQARQYENLTTGYTDKEEMDLPYILFSGETVKVTYELNTSVHSIISNLKGEAAPTAISYKAGGEGFAISIMYREWFDYIGIQYPDGQKLMTMNEYIDKFFDSFS